MDFIEHFLDDLDPKIDLITDLTYLIVFMILYLIMIACQLKFKIDKAAHFILIFMLIGLFLRASLSRSNGL